MLQAGRYRWKTYTMGLRTGFTDLRNGSRRRTNTSTISLTNVTNGALVVLGKVEDGDITVDIPNELLKRSGTIQAYVYKTIPGEGKTIFEIRLSVKHEKARRL